MLPQQSPSRAFHTQQSDIPVPLLYIPSPQQSPESTFSRVVDIGSQEDLESVFAENSGSISPLDPLLVLNIREKLTEGSYGPGYLADELSCNPVVIKVIAIDRLPSHLQIPILKEAFQEIKIMQTCKSSRIHNIVGYQGAYRSGYQLWVRHFA
jgi:hypothetical protein